MKRLAYFVPVAIFAVLAIYFAVGLTLNPKIIPSVLVNQTVPPFDLPAIKGRDRGLKTADLIGDVSLVNVFGSWCVACQFEHPFLMKLQREGKVPLHGIDWKEKNPDDGPRWLAKKGDPYTLIGNDPDSRGAIAFGVSGAPETFIIDRKGIIRYKRIGPMDQQIWDQVIWPLIEKIKMEDGT